MVGENAPAAELLEVRQYVSGPLGNNVYLLIAPWSKQAVVVDVPIGAAALVQRELAASGTTLARIVLTHNHFDHMAEAGALAAATGAPIAAHRLDAGALAQPRRSTLFPDVEVPPAPVSLLLEEGDRIAVGGASLDVLHTPGHTPGSICLYLPAQQTLLAGDTLFAGSYGRVDLPGGDERQMLASLRRLATLPAATRVLPGHGAATTVGAETWLRRIPAG